jgi:hypothetical protein
MGLIPDALTSIVVLQTVANVLHLVGGHFAWQYQYEKQNTSGSSVIYGRRKRRWQVEVSMDGTMNVYSQDALEEG